MAFLYIGRARGRKKVRIVFEYSRKLFLISLVWLRNTISDRTRTSFHRNLSAAPNATKAPRNVKKYDIGSRPAEGPKQICSRSKADRKPDGALCFFGHPLK